MIVSSGKLKLYPTVQRQTLQNQCFGLATTDETIAHKQGEKVSLKKSKNHVIYSVRLVIISRVRIGFARVLACFLVPVPCLEKISDIWLILKLYVKDHFLSRTRSIMERIFILGIGHEKYYDF